jgi:hypothetical protein
MYINLFKRVMKTRKRNISRARRAIDMALYIHGVNTPSLNRRIQRGGARVRCGRREGIIEADGFRYRYYCYEDDENTLIFNGGSGRPCFVLSIEPAKKTALLIPLERNPSCSMDTGATTKTAGKAAFALAAERGVRTITLTDNATRPVGDKKFVVSDMEFLSEGKSWYETFLPVKPSGADANDIEVSRITVQTNTWTTVYACLRQRHPDIVIPVSLAGIEPTKPGSAMEVFRRIKQAKGDFFAEYRITLPICSGIPSLFGTTWVAQLNPDNHYAL